MTGIEYLFSLEQLGIKFGLENIERLTGGLGHPERAFRSVLVAGTNGKGSVCAMVEAALRAAGWRTGRYTSPHLIRVEEKVAAQAPPLAVVRSRVLAQWREDLQEARLVEAMRALRAKYVVRVERAAGDIG